MANWYGYTQTSGMSVMMWCWKHKFRELRLCFPPPLAPWMCLQSAEEAAEVSTVSAPRDFQKKGEFSILTVQKWKEKWVVFISLAAPPAPVIF